MKLNKNSLSKNKSNFENLALVTTDGTNLTIQNKVTAQRMISIGLTPCLFDPSLTSVVQLWSLEGAPEVCSEW